MAVGVPRTIGILSLTAASVVSLAFPIVTPPLAALGCLAAYVLWRRSGSTIALVCLIVCGLALVAGVAIDTTLIAVSHTTPVVGPAVPAR